MVKGNAITSPFGQKQAHKSPDLPELVSLHLIGEEETIRAFGSHLFRLYMLHWSCRLCAS